MDELTAADILRPAYGRKSLSPGIVHIGLGNFHRAHQAWYLHRLMQTGRALDWAIWGAGVRPYDASMRETLLAQDCLTTLIELSPEGTRAEVIGPMVDYLPVEDDNAALIRGIADPRIRIVSLTVTEGGYYLDPATGGFDAGHEDMTHDAAHLGTPRTGFGAILAGLRQRRDRGHGPVTLLSCDNLQGNGDILRQTVLGLARLGDGGLADWVDQACSFPNSMVDCIVPATGAGELAMAQAMGLEDAAPVTHENFRQWVIEDDFCAGRPDFDLVGATFTQDVHAYEAMKLRILNAGHQFLANAGELMSLETIADCVAHPGLGGFFRKVLEREVAPFVASVPGMTPEAYIAQTETRFANPRIRDTTRRVAFDGTARHTGFVLPIIRDAVAAGAPVEGLALAEALWARMCAGTREDGSFIEPNDPHWEALVAAAEAARARPGAWLEQDGVYGDLAEAGPFADAFCGALTRIWDQGVEAALAAYVSR